MSAVDQGYRYAINLPCDWIIVTSIRQTRLYYKGADQKTYERFETERLAAEDALLKRFLFLLAAGLWGAYRVLGTPSRLAPRDYDVVLADIQAGIASEAARRVMESDQGRKMIAEGLSEAGRFLAAELLRGQ